MRVQSLAIVCVLSLSLSACGSSGGGGTPTTPTPTPTPAPANRAPDITNMTVDPLFGSRNSRLQRQRSASPTG